MTTQEEEVTPVIETPKPVEPVVETPKSEDEAKVFDEAYVKGLRDEAAKHRTEKQAEKTKNEELLAKLKEYEDAKLSDEEKRERDFEDMKSSNAVAVAKAKEAEINFQLAKAALDPDNEIGDINAAVKLIDRDSFEFDDKGNITNLQDALATLKEQYPSVVRQKTPTAPNTGTVNPGKQGGKAKYTREDLKSLPPTKVSELYKAGELKHLLG